MADYGAAVVKAVVRMLEAKGASGNGASAASRKGDDFSISGKVQALQEWMRTEHAALGLDTWDSAGAIGLPSYDKNWGSLRSGVDKWSTQWRDFHDKWAAQELEVQKEASSKRKSTDSDLLDSLQNGDFVSYLSEATLGASKSDGNNGDVHQLEGNLHVSGSVLAESFKHHGADFAEMYSKLRQDEPIAAMQVVGLFGNAISLQTDGAIAIGVVSEAPGICGNMPRDSDESSAKVPVVWAGWQGQVPVCVRGHVEEGAKLIPSGLNDGCAVAVSRDDQVTREDQVILGVVELVMVPDDTDPRRVLLLMGTTSTSRATSSEEKSPKTSEVGWDFIDESTISEVEETDTGQSGYGKSSFSEIQQAAQP